MIFRVIIEERASQDIAEYGRWIFDQGSDLNTERWLAAIEEAILSLSRMPKRCGIAPESAAFDEEIRQLHFKSHRILFVIEANEVHVVHVRHGARLPLMPPDSETSE